MGHSSNSKRLLSQELIQEISLETGIAPAFVEKDWYAVQLLKLISTFQSNNELKIIFSGGTSLSKGYNIIKRFSEDLDFFIDSEAEPSQGQRRAFRKDILNCVSGDLFNIDAEKVQRGNEHRFFKAPIKYKKIYEHSSLRPDLQLEMTFCKTKLPAEIKSISSIISQTLKEEPETVIQCVSPLETAGDKLSALTWRILLRDRNSDKDDPTLIRHLHDLAALETIIRSDTKNFILSASQSLEQDQNRRGKEKLENISVKERLLKALDILATDSTYKKEYEQFVLNMSYANEDKAIKFDAALAIMQKIVLPFTTS